MISRLARCGAWIHVPEMKNQVGQTGGLIDQLWGGTVGALMDVLYESLHEAVVSLRRGWNLLLPT